MKHKSAEKDDRSMREEANLGQKEAKKEKGSQSQLRHVGEHSKGAGSKNN